jgi:hypothetical protein
MPPFIEAWFPQPGGSACRSHRDARQHRPSLRRAGRRRACDNEQHDRGAVQHRPSSRPRTGGHRRPRRLIPARVGAALSSRPPLALEPQLGSEPIAACYAPPFIEAPRIPSAWLGPGLSQRSYTPLFVRASKGTWSPARADQIAVLLCAALHQGLLIIAMRCDGKQRIAGCPASPLGQARPALRQRSEAASPLPLVTSGRTLL